MSWIISKWCEMWNQNVRMQSILNKCLVIYFNSSLKFPLSHQHWRMMRKKTRSSQWTPRAPRRKLMKERRMNWMKTETRTRQRWTWWNLWLSPRAQRAERRPQVGAGARPQLLLHQLLLHMSIKVVFSVLSCFQSVPACTQPKWPSSRPRPPKVGDTPPNSVLLHSNSLTQRRTLTFGTTFNLIRLRNIEGCISAS